MSVLSVPAVAPPAVSAAPRRGIRFWVRRYLLAEIVGTATLLLLGLLILEWITHPVAVAVAAIIGESLGFYAVLAVIVLLEQRRLGRRGFRALSLTVVLLVAEFGAAELVDSFVVRPAAISLCVWLIPEPFWGLLAGKILADLVFYAMAATSFVLTTKTRLRPAHPEKAS
ncbi:hypothetical protein QSU92_13000 [Microbacterium sp. ET2]|uniref:hypothetical protein n=1 Tax=Microbacterium albipurpureum TaxID=3050384 RepID=UPI00259CF099|nr:hypothetical protein [Microbacterium sp. ET2 (Ac-2212)]WJL94872.1 hypothetical protein QSU92_13000 [Microbacterium sp. ET2 (Ac-2212)]